MCGWQCTRKVKIRFPTVFITYKPGVGKVEPLQKYSPTCEVDWLLKEYSL